MTLTEKAIDILARVIESELPPKGDPDRRSRGSFVWVCRKRSVAYEIASAIDATQGECRVSRRYPRNIGRQWAGPRWVVRAICLSERELAAVQRVAARLDPSITPSANDRLL